MPEEPDAEVKDFAAEALSYSREPIQDHLDEYEHFGNRRLRTVGELIQEAFRIGLYRMERVVRERLTTEDADTITPQTIVNIRPVVAALKEFFGSSQLSQFMDQTNSLAGLRHRRRLCALGAGGLTRERAPIEVRDVHPTHYGRMCPIETPEGPNIGLIGSLSSYAEISEHGFVTTPYRIVKDGKVTDEIVRIDATQEEERRDRAGQHAARRARQAGRQRDPVPDAGGSVRDRAAEGGRSDRRLAGADLVGHDGDDPVPRARRRQPRADGLEHAGPGCAAARHRRAADRHRHGAPRGDRHRRRRDRARAGTISYVDAEQLIVEGKEGGPGRVRAAEVHALEPGHADPPEADRRCRDRPSRRATCSPTAPRPTRARWRWARTCSSPSCPGRATTSRTRSSSPSAWSQDDELTSIHIEEYEIDARTTKLGDEEITRDIPNRSEESLRNLDDRGIVRIGAEVASGDLLVGKVTPKGETELTAEEKLIRAIFKEKAREVRDTSLKVPHGEGGVVIDVKTFSRDEGDDLPPGVNDLVRVFVAKKRKIAEGDKLAGRHGNKGVISKIVDVQDMPFLEDGTPVDVILNPLGVPSRMNLGQILETHLGWVAANGWYEDGSEARKHAANGGSRRGRPARQGLRRHAGVRRRHGRRRRRGARALAGRARAARSGWTSTSAGAPVSRPRAR